MRGSRKNCGAMQTDSDKPLHKYTQYGNAYLSE